MCVRIHMRALVHAFMQVRPDAAEVVKRLTLLRRQLEDIAK